MAESSQANGPWGRPALASAIVLLAGACGGCLAGSLATNTGERGTGQWSIDRRQRVHVGETVELSFVLTEPWRQKPVNATGLADYCVFEIGADRVEADVNELGGFRAQYTFGDIHPGYTITVTARAYRQRGDRDFKKIGVTWLRNESPLNDPDDQVAGAKVRLVAYQSHVRIALPRPADEFDFATARLLIRRSDGRSTAVYRHRPPRKGFELLPRPAGDGWWVSYLPGGNQVNPCATTEVEFSVYDLAGNRHHFTDTIDTP